MLPISRQGAVWLFGLLTIKDDQGKEAMLAHYSRHLALNNAVEHGLARFDDAKGHFVGAQAAPPNHTSALPTRSCSASGRAISLLSIVSCARE